MILLWNGAFSIDQNCYEELCSVIGLKISPHQLDKSYIQDNHELSARGFPALGVSYVHLLRVLIGSLWWATVIGFGVDIVTPIANWSSVAVNFLLSRVSRKHPTKFSILLYKDKSFHLNLHSIWNHLACKQADKRVLTPWERAGKRSKEREFEAPAPVFWQARFTCRLTHVTLQA